MRGNVLGPVDKTVNVLIDRSYPVIKEVYLNLKAIKAVYEKEEAILSLHQNLDKIVEVEEAARHLNRIHESIDKLDEIQASLEDVVAVAGKLDQIEKASEITDHIGSISAQIKEITKVADNLEDVSAVSKNLENIQYVVENLETIKNTVNNAVRAEEAAAIATEAKEHIEAASENINIKADEANQLYSNIISTASNSLAQINDTASIRKDELLAIAGNYYKPNINEEGILYWDNTGNLPNPTPVNIKGPKGDKGEAGTGLKISGEFATLYELTSNIPVGKDGLTYFISDINECYTWDINKKAWVSLGPIKGAQGEKGDPGISANEILMFPDPVEYFDEIYGKTDLVTGDLVVDIAGTDPDATDIFEEALN